MTLKGGTTQACAACKFQRRKCTPECVLAPYFPADQPKVFQNVHKLFGVSNIQKILKELEPSQKKIAMDSIIYQSNIRDKNPVHGCWEVICRLRYQIWQMEEELRSVHQQLEICRHHYHHHQRLHGSEDHQLELGMSMTPCSNALQLFDQIPQSQGYGNIVPLSQQQQQHSYPTSNNEIYNNNNSIYLDSKDNLTNHLWVQHSNGNTNSSNVNCMTMQSHLVDSQHHPQVIQQGIVENYDEMHPFFDTIDDRQSYIYSKETSGSSSEESMKDSTKYIEYVTENELKNAAVCFSLTSVN